MILLSRILIFSIVAMGLIRTSAGADEVAWRKERAATYEAAQEAISELKQFFNLISLLTFSSDATEEAIRIGSVLIPSGSSRMTVIRQRIQFLCAQIDLAQDYPATSLKGKETLDSLLKGNDFFGISVSKGMKAFEAKQDAIEKLFADPELQLGNRIFGLMQTGRDTDQETISKWVEFIERVAGPYYVGTTLERQPTTLARSLKALAILRGVADSSDFKKAIENNPDLRFRYEEALNQKLRPAVINFTRIRYQKGGMLRDWCLPMASAVSHLFPDLDRAKLGITSLAEYQKDSLAHARAMTRLIEIVDSEGAKPGVAAKHLGVIQSYKEKPHYIGSSEIRESGTLKVPPGKEIEILLSNANFFGADGHRQMKTYQQRSKQLEQLFFNSAEPSNLEILISLKSNREWIVFFNEELLGGKKKQDTALFPYIAQQHKITLDHLKVLFLARSILPKESFAAQFEEGSRDYIAYQALLRNLDESVTNSAVVQFRNYPKHWMNIQNGFLEIARGFPKYTFDDLKVTTSTDLAAVRKDFETALYGQNSIPSEFESLLRVESSDVLPSIDQMTSPELSRRIGKFDKKLSPEFVARVNQKLSDILEYRTYGLAAIDNLERPELRAGRIMTHFVVSDYRLPGNQKTNTVMHDLVCGVEGGFGGLGELFCHDAKGYKERESVLDAIATSEELDLGEALFKLAIDIDRENQTSDEDLARAARRWIQYFRKSQANARYHSVPEVLTQAVRGTFLSRLVLQSESFQKAMESSTMAPVGSPLDISHDFEAALSAQIRKMQSMLRQIDPETATNRNIEETAKKWQDFKVWYLESNKWLEAVIGEPLLIGEVTRIRKLSRKTANYKDLCPEVLVFQKTLEHERGGLFNLDEPSTLALARFAIEQVTSLEPDLELPLPEMEGSPENEEKLKQMEFGKTVSNQFLNDIRGNLKEFGFEGISRITDADQVEAACKDVLVREQEKRETNPTAMMNRAKAMEMALNATVSRAISRVEAEQPSDFKTLHGQAIRAAKVDRILTEDQLEQYQINIEPSILVTDWINRHRVEIMADFRTIELSSEARQMINKAKEERRSMIEVQDELRQVQAKTLQKMELLQRWIDESDSGTEIGVVSEEVLAMREEIGDLRKQVANLRDSEALMRARAAEYAQRLFLTRRSLESQSKDRYSADDMAGAIAAAPDPEDRPRTIRPPSSPRPLFSSPPRNVRPPTTTRPRNSGGFFRRLFGR